ncbi:MAG: hypothetical protein BWZ05_00929 [Bacteroidetes bacterium ADurb.BinA245]|nr:MAG: hypothetical protein BWZ05_00929 [Bacteroidetes bacterium ADurb.BinA245]
MLYWAGGEGMSCNMESDVTDLPEPDSPTSATTSFRFISNEICFTAFVFPEEDKKSTDKFWMLSSGCITDSRL